MDARTFYRSATALRPFFAELAEAGERGDPMLTLRKIGLRAERAMLEATGGACFALIASVEDTNILHRGGVQGLRFARQAAQSFLYGGGVARSDWRRRAAAVHLAFVERGLSPGGCSGLAHHEPVRHATQQMPT